MRWNTSAPLIPLCLLFLAGPAPAADKVGRDHWSFQPVVRPDVPAPSDGRWARNPIDAFISARHADLGLTPRPEAAKHVLLRRLYLDLIGLPPTRAELHAFLADASPDAYEKVVDRLLDLPQYGQRWGRHWMDVWRYSDWAGYQAEVRESQPHVWRWRDWIVESLNADKPYDQMVREMLAGDEIAPGDPGVVRATGFLAQLVQVQPQRLAREHRRAHVQGLSRNHRQLRPLPRPPVRPGDTEGALPLSRVLRAVPGEDGPRAGGAGHGQGGSRARVRCGRGGEDVSVRTGERESTGADRAAGAGRAGGAGGGAGDVAVASVALPREAYYPALQPWIREEASNSALQAVTNAEGAVAEADKLEEGAQKLLDESAAPDAFGAARAGLTKAQGAATLARLKLAAARAERATVAAKLAADGAKFAAPPADNAASLAASAGRAEREAAVWGAKVAVLTAETAGTDEANKSLGDLKKKLDAARAKLKEPATDYTPLVPAYPPTSTGRRLALANWITHPGNPLAARVAVNHLWARHFGEGLVPTVFDFGGNGKRPTHPALLDWLAADLRDNGWRMKRLHRLIVTSAAYRMDSSDGTGADRNRAADPDNHFLWRAPVRRMEAELVRDSLLSVANKLDLTPGGPELDQAAGLTSNRRSMYYRHAHEKQMELLRVFDAASPNECYRRQHSVVPQQALALANSPLAAAQARVLAAELSKDAGADFVTAAYEQVLGRPPNSEERGACEEFLRRQAAMLADPGKLQAFQRGDAPSIPPSNDASQRARENLVHVLLNHNDFVTIR